MKFGALTYGLFRNQLKPAVGTFDYLETDASHDGCLWSELLLVPFRDSSTASVI
jgi:hypothetical protein